MNLKKKYFTKVISICLLCVFSSTANAAISIAGATNIDGDLDIQENTIIDLSASPNNEKYDADKWAVIFRYSSVNIAAGKTLSFKNHPKGAPVVWLVDGNVTIDGTINIAGGNYKTNTYTYTQPGPGGFHGGIPTKGDVSPASGGFGPGGGLRQGDGSYSTPGITLPGGIYGNSLILPLIGGSGGGGDPYIDYDETTGGAGGGAILIAASGKITVNGVINANGGYGHGNYSPRNSGSGSGGAIRLIADQIFGAGELTALGGLSYSQNGGQGRIRIEANNRDHTILSHPPVGTFDPGSPVKLWLSDIPSAPQLKVLSIGSVDSTIDPTGSIYSNPDIILPHTSTTIDIKLEGSNIMAGAEVTVRVVPTHGAPLEPVLAIQEANTNIWTATVTPPQGYFVVYATAVNPVQ